jgi:hypothetical protein
MGSSPKDQEKPGKEASNLIVLVSELYNFQVISCILIYDLVRGLLSKSQLSEYNVELLLKVLRSKCLYSLPLRFAKLSKILGCNSDKMTHLR